jgi:hypothetical protein
MTATHLALVLLPAAATAAANYVVAERLAAVGAAACVSCLAWLVGAPLLLGFWLAVLPLRAEAPAVADPEPRDDAALRLLSDLQEGGRLVDFLVEELSGYTDEQIGAAVRGLHDGCRKALRERVALEPVLHGAEGEMVTVEPGFDPAAIRLTGKVSGSPPFRGVLRHAGWRATQTTLPARRSRDPHVIAPAEVEIA